MNFNETFLNDHFYLTFYDNNQIIGKFIFKKYSNFIFITFIYIEPQFRKLNYLNKMFNIFSNIYNFDIILEAEEDDTKYNKLINHYIKHGFNIISNPKYQYNGDILYRKILMKKNFIN